ncbi:MAG TPA: aminotransferase class V-fold PLP-dependent enzyme [Candidatus Limnocylindrales bacterium]|nr:aminotransferase class V-fold PLP-dependent enzyme [Candidatus Limnocylindrales bacterium]
MDRGEIYRRLGVEPIINANATETILGGSLLRPEVVDAMAQAADSFVDLVELEGRVGERLASLTRNEAAFVCGGAASGLFLTAVACMTRGVEDGILRFEDLPALPREFVVHPGHLVPYVSAIQLAGGHLIEVGSTDGTSQGALEDAITDRTAGILVIAGAHLDAGTLPLATVIATAHARGIPVIVDAAAQIPPVSSLWEFSAAGADFTILSGGKGLRGPANTGLIVGPGPGIRRCAANAAPLDRVGRPMKVGKEDLIGILTAVETALADDEAATIDGYERIVRHVIDWGGGRPDVDVIREVPSEAGQPMPRARVTLHGAIAARRDEVIADLRAGRPRVSVRPAGADGIYVNPQTLLDGEVEIVCRRLAEILDEGPRA